MSWPKSEKTALGLSSSLLRKARGGGSSHCCLPRARVRPWPPRQAAGLWLSPAGFSAPEWAKARAPNGTQGLAPCSWDPLGLQPNQNQVSLYAQGLAVAETHEILSPAKPERQTVLKGWPWLRPMRSQHEIQGSQGQGRKALKASCHGSSAKISWSRGWYCLVSWLFAFRRGWLSVIDRLLHCSTKQLQWRSLQ